MPEVTVVMPVYNAQDYLITAVESILNQSYCDFEFIIIDDGSIDNSYQILNEYALKDSRIVLIRRENKGLVYTLNQACDLAKGAFIARMDADDEALPERLAIQVDFLKTHREISVAGGQVELIDSDGWPIMTMGELTQHADIDQAHMRGEGGAIIHPAATLRKELLHEVGGYSESYTCAEDLDLWLRMAEVGQLANCSEVILKYRQHVDSIGSSRREEQYLSAKRAVMDAHDRRGIQFTETAFPEYKKTPSLAALYLKWGWWSLGANNVATARKYALRRLRATPFNTESIKLLLASLRGW